MGAVINLRSIYSRCNRTRQHRLSSTYHQGLIETSCSLFSKLDWLTVSKIIVYHTLITVYRIRKTRTPEHLASIPCKENHNGHIVIKNPKLELYRDSLIFRGAITWNNLPRNVKSSCTLGVFKKHLRKWIIGNIPRFVG